jgi:hypothetical protein
MNIGDDEKVSKNQKVNKPIPLILTNNKNNSSTNMYINKYTVIQDSTKINIEIGYRYRYSAYDINEDKLHQYKLDSISESDNNGIILKGNPILGDNILYNKSIKDVWMGKINTDNIHKEYLHSELQNKNNLEFLQKLKIIIKLNKPNYGLYRFQKVLLEIYNYSNFDDNKIEKTKYSDNGKSYQKSYDNQSKQKTEKDDTDTIIHKLSGEWLITAINFTFSSKDGNVQEVTLVKRELTDEYTYPRKKIKN